MFVFAGVCSLLLGNSIGTAEYVSVYDSMSPQAGGAFVQRLVKVCVCTQNCIVRHL